MVPAANLTDSELMQRYVKGDASAFKMLYTRHKDPLYRYLLRGCNNRDTAAELFQDIWLRIINARARYRPSGRFATYLFGIAHNRLVDFYRSRRIEPVFSTEIAAPAAEQPEAQLDLKQKAQRLITAINALPFDQREAILLKEERDFSLDEIATITGVGRETVKSRLRYALAKLRKDLGNE